MTKEIKDNEIESSHASKRKETDSPRDLEKQEIPMRSQAESSRITLTTKEEDENKIKSTDDETETDLELKGMGIDHWKMKRHSSVNPASTMSGEDKGDGIESAQTADVDAVLSRDLEKQEAIARRPGESSREPSSVRVKIQKVPESIKQLRGGQNFHMPREISIGPIHAGNKELAKRDLKLLVAAKFVEGSRKSKEELVGLVKAKLEAIKECYEESVIEPFNDDELLNLLFLDACFVLQFITAKPGELVKLGISYKLQNSINQDMFYKLENQLPMHLLDILTDESQMTMVYHYCFAMAYDVQSLTNFRKWMNLVFSKEKPSLKSISVHLLDLLRTMLLYPLNNSISAQQSFSHENLISFGNVQDLKNAGIKVKPSKAATLSDVSFSSSWLFNATLRLPVLTVDSSMVTRLLNLVAYEMCPDNKKCGFGVSSYLWLMDSLVDTEQDVRDLRETGVLRNRFGSDEEVATLFNEIGLNLVVPTDAYERVQEQIQKHYDRRKKWSAVVEFVEVSKLSQWCTQLYEDYFSSPWKVVALIAGALVLFFGGVSAYFAAFPPQHGK